MKLHELCHWAREAWCHNHFPGEPVLVPDHSLGEEPFPNTHLELLPRQLHAVPSGPFAGQQRASPTGGVAQIQEEPMFFFATLQK